MSTPTAPATEPEHAHGTDTDGESVGGTPAGHPVGREGARVEVVERKAWYVDGILAVVVGLVCLGLAVWLFVMMGTTPSTPERGVRGSPARWAASSPSWQSCSCMT